MESIESLLPGGYKLIQDDRFFKLGTDSVLLASFPALRPGTKVCDLGCGVGALCILMAARQQRLMIDGLELFPEAAEIAARNAALNGLEERVRILQGDLREPKGLLEPGAYDVVVSNPPYYQCGSGYAHGDPGMAASRDERMCTIEDVCSAAARLTKWGGRFAVVYKPERLIDLILAMRKSGLEPKRIRFVIYRAGHAPSLVLAEGIRGASAGLVVEPDLIVSNEDGSETEEMRAIYRREG